MPYDGAQVQLNHVIILNELQVSPTPKVSIFLAFSYNDSSRRNQYAGTILRNC